MSKTAKQPLVRISNEVLGATPGHQGGCPGLWFVRKFLVQQTYPVGIDETPLYAEVKSADEARRVAEDFAARLGGRIYRGHLPESWHAALADFPRS